MNLSEKEFAERLMSMLTERDDLKDYTFSEVKYPNISLIIRAEKNGKQVNLVVSIFYRRYKTGSESIQKLADEAASVVLQELGEKADSSEIQSLIQSINEIFDTNKEKEDLLQHVTGFFVSEKNKDKYQGCAYTNILGMTFIYNKGSLDNIVPVTVDEISRLNIPEDELHDAAIENLVNRHQLNFKLVAGGILVSNDIRKRGAAAFIYPGFLNEFANHIDDDLLIVPISEDAVYITYAGANLTQAKLLMNRNDANLLTRNLLYYNRLQDALQTF